METVVEKYNEWTHLPKIRTQGVSKILRNQFFDDKEFIPQEDHSFNPSIKPEAPHLGKNVTPDQINQNKAFYESGNSAVKKLTAEQAGYIVIEPKENELFIDIDNYENYTHCMQSLNNFKRLELIVSAKQTRSKSNNWHIIATLKENKSIWERIALQCALGSDPKHECCCIRDVVNKEQHPIMLWDISTAVYEEILL